MWFILSAKYVKSATPPKPTSKFLAKTSQNRHVYKFQTEKSSLYFYRFPSNCDKTCVHLWLLLLGRQPERKIKGVGGGLWSKSEISFILTYVVALCFLYPKWSQPCLKSYWLKFGGRKHKDVFAKYIGNQEMNLLKDSQTSLHLFHFNCNFAKQEGFGTNKISFTLFSLLMSFCAEKYCFRVLGSKLAQNGKVNETYAL